MGNENRENSITRLLRRLRLIWADLFPLDFRYVYLAAGFTGKDRMPKPGITWMQDADQNHHEITS
ncbi:MAG: hypothetical protein EBU49_08280 [Proteobacteria bacterium]|nr:hypothetical protein [Pseudomonadota bacterium]